MRALARVWFSGFAFLLLTMAACHRAPEQLDSASADAWSKLIVGHTSGVMSRRGEIRVLFANDVALAQGKKPKPALRVNPAVDGEITLRGPRELVLVPRAELKPGQEYRVTLVSEGLAGVPTGIAPYQFAFHVQTPQFDLALDELASDETDDKLMIQRGRVTTADTEDAAKIEKMLRAIWRGNAVPVVWTHSGDGREHGFTLQGVERQRAAEQLQIRIDGKAIGASDEATRDITVPPLGRFSVVNALGLEDEGRKQLQVTFSDRLDDMQDLRGLVRLSAGGFTTRIDGNQLIVYPADDPNGALTLTIEAGIRNTRGEKLAEESSWTLTLESQKPGVRFVGNGVILPDAKQMTVPFEAVSARSVQVIATRVYPENIPQFLQVNTLSGNRDIGRVGRHLWRKTITLTGPRTGRWQRYELDVTELMQKNPGTLIQLTLQLTPPDSAYACPGAATMARAPKGLLTDQESDEQWINTAWQYSGEYFGVAEEEGEEVDYRARWEQRKDPCHNAYYTYSYDKQISAQRNLIASNIGMLAKADAHGRLLVSVTNLATTQPLGGVSLQLRNYQNQLLATASSDRDGMATFEPASTPFLLVAQSGTQLGYLRLNAAGALPVSHFDVGGETLQKGLKGTIYGERGVWRPGDALGLTFVVNDREGTLPANHPATLELYDPRGRVAQTLVNAQPVDGFYRFDARTAADAPTGNWTAKVSLGGASFTRTLKVETVMPNRLKLELDMGQALLGGGEPLRGKLSSQWLSGATAAGLKADVFLKLSSTQTKFKGFEGFDFDDPAREFRAEPQQVFEGDLDGSGDVRFEKALGTGRTAPGMLNASFTSRVFERGGAFSIQYDARPFAPYSRFVGVKLPEGKHNTLPVDQDHSVDIASLTAQGAVAPNRKLSVKMYKVDWRWWWDRGNDNSLAAFVAREASTRVREDTVTTNAQGRAQWQFRMPQSQWGRYLLRVCDDEGGHCTGTIFYADWPYWQGEGREMEGPAATMLELTADKENYQVGETATIQLPESAQGRALLTVENGAGVLEARWVNPQAGNTRVSIPVTASMAPNAYVAVTLLQPHAGKKNDRPIRLYGVIPLLVADPATTLKPVLQTTSEWRPETEVAVKISEANGKPMTYTLAVVDEGLLSLTNFRTPSLHDEFFRREALGVKTWDLYDLVSGAYGAALERMLALGGSDAAAANASNQQQSRFQPVAQVLGPFHLEGGKSEERKVKLPRYVGAVRVMVVAGTTATKPAAYGSTEKSIFVRQPLMILPTMPRVVGPGEEISVPVSVFAMNDSVRDVKLTITPDSMFEVVGDATTQLAFDKTGEKIGMLKLRVAQRVGNATVKFAAVSGRERAQDEIHIEVRSPNAPSTRFTTHLLQPGESWTAAIKPHGMAGTNRVTLEVSRLPPINLERRLGYLIGYPHGCLEQTTSAAFPQLFLPMLVKLDDVDKRRTEANVRAAIERLREFQLGNGAFSYWPGGTWEARDGYHYWAATYASHFLVEAEKQGYTVPAALRAGMIRSLRSTVQGWKSTDSAALVQAYRLYVLARAGQPEVGAMNRLRELRLDSVSSWTLAAAYQLAGLGDAARALSEGDPLAVREYRPGDFTFGSSLRDHALVLQSMVILGKLDQAAPLVREISRSLSDDSWYSTQETAYSLLAVAQLSGARSEGGFSFSQTLSGKTSSVNSTATMHRAVLATVPDAGTDLALRNSSQGILFATVTVRGTPPAEQEQASASGLDMRVSYADLDGNPVQLDKVKQGTDLVVDIELRNTTRFDIRNIALTQIVPAGWEIANERMAGEGDGKGDRDANYRWQQYRNQNAARTDYVDIRDDRVLQYFRLEAGTSIHFQTRVNAAYRGRYYQPGIVAEAMYDATMHASSAGRWTEVVAQ